MDAHAAQWVGRRLKQEDAYGVRHFPEGSLALVCDGMGGHMLGELASATAVRSFIDAFAECLAAGDAVAEALHEALMRANDAVGEIFAAPEAFGGTTLVASFAGHGVLHWVSVGDSALYLWRQGTLRRLNADHSMRAVYEKFICPGGMTRKEALAGGHVLRSAVTGEDIPLIDESRRPLPVLPGDRLLLASDGLESLMSPGLVPPAVRSLLRQRGGNLAAELVQACAALDDPYADNVTVVSLDA